MKPKKIDILGVWFNFVTFDEVQNILMEYLDGDTPRAVFTPNPEFVMLSRKNKSFKNALNAADLCIPDGIGIVLASRFGKHKLRRRVTGYDTTLSIFNKIKNTDKTVYFYGSAPGVAIEAKEKLEATYPGLKIIGVRDGYIDEDAQNEMIMEIQQIKPDILLVGTGFPKQELWIMKHKETLPCKILMGVGGQLDGFSGRVPRVPAVIGNMGLEWLYRLVRQPKRWRRQLQLPLFMLAVLGDWVYNWFKR